MKGSYCIVVGLWLLFAHHADARAIDEDQTLSNSIHTFDFALRARPVGGVAVCDETITTLAAVSMIADHTFTEAELLMGVCPQFPLDTLTVVASLPESIPFVVSRVLYTAQIIYVQRPDGLFGFTLRITRQ